MRVLVTGGCGFIGTNLCARLMGQGHIVTVLDKNLDGGLTRAVSSRLQLVRGDIRHEPDIEAVAGGQDTVIHLAAAGSVAESVADPAANFRTNVVGTFNVLSAARRAGVGKVVLASTGGALVGDAPPPVHEETLPRPVSPYGASKLCAEAYAHAFGGAYGLETVALRFSNVYGPESAHKNGAVTTFIRAVLNRDPMLIFGDGSATRDFIHVTDLCDGIASAATTSLAPGTVLHLSSGHEISILDLARMIARVAGAPNHPIIFASKRAGEVERNFARYDRAAMLLGFRPKRTLEEGLAETVEWFSRSFGVPQPALAAQ